MARSEARISVAIWDDPDFVALSVEAQRMYLFLLSQPDLAHNGVLALRERRWARSAASLTASDITSALKELQQANYVVVDEDAEELLIRSLIRRDKVYRQPYVLQSASEHLPLVASPAILAALRSELQRIQAECELSDKAADLVRGMLDAIEMRVPEPSQDGSPHSAGDRPVDPPGEGLAEGPGDPSGEGCALSYGERGGVRRVSSDSPTPLPLTPDPPSPSKAPSEPSSRRASRAATKRGTRIPDDFQATPAMVEWARANVPEVDGRRETEKFINYWRAKSGKDATKLDWVATWRNWMLNAADRAPAGGARASPPRHQAHQNNPNANYHGEL